MISPLIVSVVRDDAMYRKCLADNAFCEGCELVKLDNRERNERIPVLYNRVLDGLDAEAPPRWIVFAHEDFEPREPLSARLGAANPARLYGLVGGRMVLERRGLFGGLKSFRYFGQIAQCGKGDAAEHPSGGGPAPLDTEVETVDCLFLAVHSSLLARFRLRFDENLSFDWYAEDFCAGALLNHGVRTAILPLTCCHHSNGSVQPRYFEQMAYLDAKYPDVELFGTVGWTLGGGGTFLRRCQKRLWAFVVRFALFAVRLRCWSLRPTPLRRFILERVLR